MVRNTIICFRTSEHLRRSLEKLSEADRRSLSSTIENVLYSYVKERVPRGVKEDKRRYARKATLLPALVTGPDGGVHAGTIDNISLGGVHVTLPGAFPCEVRDDCTVSLVFTLPESTRPVSMRCTPRHVRSNGQTSFGASCVDSDFQSCQALQEHLFAGR